MDPIINSATVLSKNQRIFLGLIVLILVDVIWVSSFELTKYIYKKETFEKPFFCTYIKTSMFTFYLLGFLLWPPWKEKFFNKTYAHLSDQEQEDYYYDNSDESSAIVINSSLSNPTYIPVKATSDNNKSSGTESDDSTMRSVRFNKVAEVRHLSEVDAADALLARLSYQASLRVNDVTKRATAKLPVQQVSKIAFVFCLLWFLANYTYEVALLRTDSKMMNILLSSSSIFVLILAGIYSSGNADKFTISKLIAVLLSFIGIVLVNMSDIKLETNIPLGTVLTLSSALCYAIYLVFLKRSLQNEEKIDIPMFFGFVGLFNTLLLWPVFLFLHATKIETFEWPTKEQMTLILVNGLMGTVISEALWLWGCFLTSSLMATVSISMTIPMTMIADVIVKHQRYPPAFYFGTLIMVLAFLMVTVYSHFENWDPVLSVLRYAYVKCCYKTMTIHSRFSDPASEQRECLMGANSDAE
ncbi:unnamed protein product [Ceutorhynchus assimilis]|uniref:Solute carrier family 35 member F5 n=1 Tax=Ceutorhynchus assimilis TaxID=467358 RepID=A0A9N9ML68_9CUCU|nr:unnamed protein product [Ceutorhynchus assimilis]